MMGLLAGRSGIVTGGASGIGRAIVTRLRREGASVAVIDRDPDGLDRLAAETQGQPVTCHAADITDHDAIEAAVAEIAAPAPIWFLVHAAGWDRPTHFLSTTPEDWRRIIDINLMGAFNIYHAVCRRMAETGGGRCIGFSSDAVRSGAAGTSLYAAAKGGLVAFSKSLARELASSNVLINVVSPGPTDTPMLRSLDTGGEDAVRLRKGLERAIPLGRIAAPEDYVGMIALLLGPDGSYITGQTISISGGLTMT